MKPGPKFLAGAAVLTFIAGIVVQFPARIANHWFVPTGVTLAGISGTIWSGSANELSVGGLYLRGVKWRLRPLRLLTAKLALDVEANMVSGIVESTVAIGFGGAITLTDLRTEVRLQNLGPMFDMPGLSGVARADFERIAFRDGVPSSADGTVTITDLVAPLIHRNNIGGYRAEFMTTSDGIVASIEDAGGVYDIAASMTLYPDRRYQLLGKVGATERTSAELRERLRFLGTPDERGQHELRLEGRL